MFVEIKIRKSTPAVKATAVLTSPLAKTRNAVKKNKKTAVTRKKNVVTRKAATRIKTEAAGTRIELIKINTVVRTNTETKTRVKRSEVIGIRTNTRAVAAMVKRNHHLLKIRSESTRALHLRTKSTSQRTEIENGKRISIEVIKIKRGIGVTRINIQALKTSTGWCDIPYFIIILVVLKNLGRREKLIAHVVTYCQDKRCEHYPNLKFDFVIKITVCYLFYRLNCSC